MFAWQVVTLRSNLRSCAKNMHNKEDKANFIHKANDVRLASYDLAVKLVIMCRNRAQ